MEKTNEKAISNSFVEAPTKTLPVTGVPIAGIRKYAELPSRATTERDLLTFINACMTAERVYGCVIKAWWGEGKTDAYENFIKPELERRGLLSYDVGATTIARIFEKRHEEKLSDAVVWVAFLSSLFEAISEERKSQIEKMSFLQRSDEEMRSDFNYIQRMISEFSRRTQKLFIFIDELEQLEVRKYRDEILLGLRGLFDQKEDMLSGRIHLIMACTPDAFNRLIGSSTQMGGLLERLTTIELPRPTPEEAVKFVYGLINYIYEGKLPSSHPFINSGPAYAVTYAGHRSPRSMIKALQQVVEFSKRLATEAGYRDSLHKIEGWIVVEALKNYSLPVFGTQVHALDGDTLSQIDNMMVIKNDPDKTENLKKLIRLLIGEPIPHSLEQLSSRVTLTEKKVTDLIGIANTRITQAGLFDGRLILELGENSKPFTDASDQLERFLISFVFYEQNADFKKRLFLPSDDSVLRTFFPDVSSQHARDYAYRLRSYREGRFYLISPELIERIYPNPDFLELDFIADKNRRLELWKEAYEEINEREAPLYIEDSLLELIRTKIVVEQT
ncbi:MAG: hypothetical protein QXO76_03630 [Thermoproteota archaeon]